MTDETLSDETESPKDAKRPVERLVSPFSGMTDKESIKHQLELWLTGNPVHNDIRDECCPDFSCCTGNIAPIEQRERFAQACAENDEKTKMEMLGMFLGNALSNEKIYVAGTEIPSER